MVFELCNSAGTSENRKSVHSITTRINGRELLRVRPVRESYGRFLLFRCRCVDTGIGSYQGWNGWPVLPQQHLGTSPKSGRLTRYLNAMDMQDPTYSAHRLRCTNGTCCLIRRLIAQ